MGRWLALMVFLGFIARPAVAELSEITVAAIVKSFDDANVTVQIQQKELRIPRRLLSQDELRIGTAVFVTFRGKQVDDLFRGLAVSQAGRQPASKNPRGR